MSTPYALFVWLFVSICVPLFSEALCDSSCDECLTQSDFNTGTYRITKSGKYCLSENIKFAPFATDETPDFNWFPHNAELYSGCLEFKNGAFALGFFAVITIETNNVELDLNNFEISQTLDFYIQQRFISIIEIGKSPFVQGFGPTNFGPLDPVNNIYIHSGKLGLSSHHGIHSNEANNVKIEDLQIYDFEVGGIQMNGFTDLILRNINIGPSSSQVFTSGYYSNGRFLSLALNKLLTEHPEKKNEIITFSGNRPLTLETIFNNLLLSMDIAFRYFTNQSTKDDINNGLYEQSISLYSNPSLLPDGSSLYGLLLHSRNLAIFGFGNFENEPVGDGENVLIENVKINDLEIDINEIPISYFDKCQDINTNTITAVKGPFGDVMDIRKMIGNNDVIDNGMYMNTQLDYIGNVLSDAQIALAIIGKPYGLNYGSNGMDSVETSVFLQWALDGNIAHLPTECISFICNNDIMQHTNKGIIGARLDLIEDVTINQLEITHIYNKSPLSSYACKNYTGQYDGGSHGQLDYEGATGTHATGMTVYGGNVMFKGINQIDAIKSNYGSAYGLHAMNNAIINMENSNSKVIIANNIKSGSLINYKQLMHLVDTNQFPYPNNFEQCNIKKKDNENIQLNPNPPHGISKILCEEHKDVIEMYKNNKYNGGKDGKFEFMNDNDIGTATVRLSTPLWINIYVLTIIFVVVHVVLGYYYCTMEIETDDRKETERSRTETITVVDSLP